MIDVNMTASFETIDKTALEFAIALIASGDKQRAQSLSKESMRLAKAWHEQTGFRRSWLLSKTLTENDWIKIDPASDYDANDFEKDQEYWVIRASEFSEDGIHPEKAIFSRMGHRKEKQQPFFQLKFNPYNPFPIEAYLPLNIGRQLLDEVPPYQTVSNDLYSNL